MRTRNQAQKTAPLGELVVAAFDKAARYSTDPGEVSFLATRAVMHVLRRTRRRPGDSHASKVAGGDLLTPSYSLRARGRGVWLR